LSHEKDTVSFVCFHKPLSFYAANEKKSRSKATGLNTQICALFFHPDYTVGFGIEPNRLSLAGLSAFAALPPVGNFTPPRRQLFHLLLL